MKLTQLTSGLGADQAGVGCSVVLLSSGDGCAASSTSSRWPRPACVSKEAAGSGKFAL